MQQISQVTFITGTHTCTDTQFFYGFENAISLSSSTVYEKFTEGMSTVQTGSSASWPADQLTDLLNKLYCPLYILPWFQAAYQASLRDFVHMYRPNLLSNRQLAEVEVCLLLRHDR